MMGSGAIGSPVLNRVFDFPELAVPHGVVGRETTRARQLGAVTSGFAASPILARPSRAAIEELLKKNTRLHSDV
ncbi:hypothetical protein GCM10008096_10530 [Zhihengliuella salsuginis]|uniref:Uncharacterized protein n=1 Tax=Zhihengliuella salsuginis TaxID=578222 RepID=A0ABQ3GEV3_9MICC|nr:hypothetical protein GCM10008096_10530 [Zhihengliuella salsuginis]